MTKTWCDFCGRSFGALAWNERTCFRCEGDGAPNQSKAGWEDYQHKLSDYLREIGKRAKLGETNLARRAMGARTRAVATKRSP